MKSNNKEDLETILPTLLSALIPIAMTIAACILLSFMDRDRQAVQTTIKESTSVTAALSNTTTAKERTTEHTDETENRIQVINDTTDNTQVNDLAVCVCREAGGESEYIQKLVATVVMNRVASDIFPDTVHGVITQPYQYGTIWRDGVHWPAWATQEIKDDCMRVAIKVINGERTCPQDVLYQAEFPQGSGIYEYIDGFYFCYE